jgi:hypothetical protein
MSDVSDSSGNQVDLLKNETELLKAKTDLLNAQISNIKALVGEISASGIEGKIELGDKAGNLEVALLSAQAVKKTADKINQTLSVIEKPASILLFSEAQLPAFQSRLTFESQFRIVDDALDKALKYSDAVMSTIQSETALRETGMDAFQSEVVVEGAGVDFKSMGLMLSAGLGSVVPAVDAGLAVVKNLLTYLKTDYTLGGIEIDSDDSLLVRSLAGLLAVDTRCSVYLPGSFSPELSQKVTGPLLARLTGLADKKQKAQNLILKHNSLAKSSTADKAQAEKYENVVTELKNAVASYDDFIKALAVADDKGIFFLTAVVREMVIYHLLSGNGYLLVLKIHKTGGSYYTKKNLWTALGRMPFHVMGGAVISYVLFRGVSGKVVVSGVLPINGGFLSLSKLNKIAAFK